MPRPRPLIWLPACHRNLDLSDAGGYTVLADRYAAAVCELGMQPVLFPLADAADVPALMAQVDGVLLTGSPSNVDAARFGGVPLADDLLDPRRDRLTMALVPAALDSGTPLLGVCRGLQEINVALGGTLHQRLHEQPGLMDHREPADADVERQFGAHHEILLAPGSRFEQWAGGPRAWVNSLHGQGIARLANRLAAEAHALDGLVEGVRVRDAPAFAYGVQWHPEWRHAGQPFYAQLLQAFAEACARHARRHGVAAAP